MATSPLNEAAAAFVAELARWRMERGLSKKQLAGLMGFDPSYVSHIEAKRHRPTADFARRAERVLRSDDNAIWRQFIRYDYLRRTSTSTTHAGVESLMHGSIVDTLMVEEEVTTLSYDQGWYTCSVVHRLVNRGSQPVTRHIAQVDVERTSEGTEQPARSRRDASFFRDQLQFHAWLRSDRREQIKWEPPGSGDTLDEILLLFETGDVPAPLYPAQRATVIFEYSLPEHRRGSWFERDIRSPTLRLRVRLNFPAELEPSVWGEQTSLAGEDALPNPSRKLADAGRVEFEWQLENPMLLTHFRFGWRFGRIIVAAQVQ